MRNGAACTFVAHSAGTGEPSQLDDLGAIARTMEAAVSAARVLRGMCGMERAEIVVLKSSAKVVNFDSIVA